MSKRIGKEEIDRFHDYGVHITTRTIYLGSVFFDEYGGESGVDFAMAERFVKNITILNAISEEPITIIMNNPGGDWYHGMAIYDAIKNSKAHVTIQVLGVAMSMGAVILQAADERVMSPNAKFMIHYGYAGMGETHTKIFAKWAKEYDKLDKVMEKVLFERIIEKNPDFKLKRLKEMLHYDTILTSEEAMALGLSDKILGHEE